MLSLSGSGSGSGCDWICWWTVHPPPLPKWRELALCEGWVEVFVLDYEDEKLTCSLLI